MDVTKNIFESSHFVINHDIDMYLKKLGYSRHEIEKQGYYKSFYHKYLIIKVNGIPRRLEITINRKRISIKSITMAYMESIISHIVYLSDFKKIADRCMSELIQKLS